MAQFLFSDNTVLVNFGLINRMDLLDKLMQGRGKWCATVAYECGQSALQEGLEALHGAPEIFGDPWYPETGAEHLDVEMFRLELAAPGDSKFQHLGEAETLALMTRRAIDALFVTDDSDARRLADQYGVRVVSTWDLLRLAARVKLVDPDTLWGYCEVLRRAHRGRPSGVTNRESFDEWIDVQG